MYYYWSFQVQLEVRLAWLIFHYQRPKSPAKATTTNLPRALVKLVDKMDETEIRGDCDAVVLLLLSHVPWSLTM